MRVACSPRKRNHRLEREWTKDLQEHKETPPKQLKHSYKKPKDNKIERLYRKIKTLTL